MINKLLDSTYLKDDEAVAIQTIKDAIEYDFKLVMIKPEMVATAKKMIKQMKSDVLVGTVIDFPMGNGTTDDKLAGAMEAVKNRADELDFVSDYEAFKAGDLEKFVTDILECTKFGLENYKMVKWIIETGALSKEEIAEITKTIADVVTVNFPGQSQNVFVKTSTGFYKGTGATPEDVAIMKQNSGRLPIKASGGVYDMSDAEAVITAGATRIGTSRAKDIVSGIEADDKKGY
ncbi:MAG: Deoxyribose-phosphate aldolase 2 [uncultured marine phage]|uniref:Deoxyribose-phosphate aldolase 2 n=1 Tax=uncultured marine phage TaxID=707152 RepID=A0A8D9C984_9VIRU|nr:MAG: Deoxyribose-phosphate aldolase 2 [uncultured marine phage]